MVFTGENPAVVVVDFQKEWSMKRSPYHIGRTSLAAEKTRMLVHEADQRDIPVIFTRKIIEYSDENAFSPYEERSDLVEKMPVEEHMSVIEHEGWNPFFQTGLHNELQDTATDSVIIAGVPVNIGVRRFIESADDLDFDLLLVEDCSMAKDSETFRFTIEDLQTHVDLATDIVKNFQNWL